MTNSVSFLVQDQNQNDVQPVRTTMHVTKRNGSQEPVDLSKIVRAIERCCMGLSDVDAIRVATKTISGLFDGAATSELDKLSIQTAAGLTSVEPQYAKLAARLLSRFIDKEVQNQEIQSFSQSISVGLSLGLANERLAKFVAKNARKLNAAIDLTKDNEFEYFGLKTVYDRYLLRHPKTRLVIETPQQFFLRVACALSEDVAGALNLYGLFSSLEYTPSSPTLFNAGTQHEQLSSCFLLDSPEDSLDGIYDKYKDVAKLSKFSGGIGLAYHRIRSRGSLIRGTNGHSNGIIPWLNTLDSSVAAVNQGGRRKGACCVYIESWHADIEAFLELRDNTGDEASRTHNLNLANWIPDIFMRRVEEGGTWSLMDPKVVPHLPDLFGPDFDKAYLEAEAKGLVVKTVQARDLYGKMMRTLAQTGNGWMTFKDKSNLACNQTALPGRTVHLSNLCVAPETKILTRTGHVEIVGVEGQQVEVWNGSEWSAVTVKKTADDVELVRVCLSNGVEIDCTPEHRFAVSKGYGTTDFNMVAAADLMAGSKLAKFNMPVIDNGSRSSDAECRQQYASGFFTGDGTYAGKACRNTLYGEKRDLAGYLDLEGNAKPDSSGRVNVYYRESPLAPKFSVPGTDLPVNGRMAWFAGLLDSDGTVARNDTNESLQVGSVNLSFLRDVRLMLLTLGVDSKITQAHEEGFRSLPDGRGGHKEYPVQALYRLLVNSSGLFRLHELGLRTSRLKIAGREPQRDATQFVQVVAVQWTGRRSATYCFTEPLRNLGTFNGVVTGQCTEILEITSGDESAVCNLGSINLGRHMRQGEKGQIHFDFDKLASTVRSAVRQLDLVIDLNFYPIESAKRSNMKWRPVGLGLMGLQDVFFHMGLPFDSAEARALSKRISEAVYFHALSTSCSLAAEKGKHPGFDETRTARGELQFDAWGITPSDEANWNFLRDSIKESGLRNSLLIAIAPTATIASITGCYECIEPQVSNLFKRETLSGDFLQVNRYLVNDLKKLGLWTEDTRNKLKVSEGSIQGMTELPEQLREVYRTVWEIPMRSLIDMAADRGAFIDQSQSLNLFIENPNIGQLSSMYFYAWKKGLKTTYYLRSRPATRIAKTTVQAPAAVVATVSEAVACSLENPGSCEACQ